MLLIGHTLSEASNACPLALRIEFTLEANVSERDKVSGRGNFKENVIGVVKSGGAWSNVHVMRGNSFSQSRWHIE